MKLSRRAFGSAAAAIGFASLASLSSPAFAAETVSIYTYHNHPPFVLEAGKGLSYELADYLNRKSKGNPTFKIEVVTRPQLDKLLAAPDFNGVVAWIAPEWVKDKEKATYLWTPPVMEDANVILSSSANRLEYKDPSSLKGKNFGGIAGHKYGGIDDLVAAGAVKREDAEKERNNLRKLEAGRIDATLLPRSTANYLLAEMALGSKVYVAPTPQSSYSRLILVPKKSVEVQKLLANAVSEMPKDSGWQATLTKYSGK
jgi:polar amino acid transport system substrate-binding protein